jgi:hypothetical protein
VNVEIASPTDVASMFFSLSSFEAFFSLWTVSKDLCLGFRKSPFSNPLEFVLHHRIRFINRRGKERERKSNFDAGKNHATTIVGTPVAAIEPVLGDAGDDAIASV